MPYALGEIVLAMFGYLIQQWQTLQIVLSVIVLCLSVAWFFVPESPRWLIAKDRRTEAFVVLNKGATQNNKTFTTKQFEKLFASSITDTTKTKMGLISLFREWYIARNTLILSINFMVCSMSYYGLAMNQVNLGNNIYVSFALGGVVEILGYVFAYLVIDHIGRKTVLVGCQVISGISCILGGVFNDDSESNLVLALSLIGKC